MTHALHSFVDQPLRHQALEALAERTWSGKLAAVRAIADGASVDVDAHLAAPPDLPGRPDVPVLVPAQQVARRSVQSPEGRAILFHALTHIEFNAINLALDVVWRFAGMPEAFYRDWLHVAREEAYHFELLNNHLSTLGHTYGDFPAHNGLWEMAEKTSGDLLARLALVPRTLEARGLDATPLMRNKLNSAGDKAGAAILDIILRDEIGHVMIGNHWYRYLCTQQGREPIATYAEVSKYYGAPRLRGPFNLEARRLAGFDEAELTALQESAA